MHLYTNGYNEWFVCNFLAMIICPLMVQPQPFTNMRLLNIAQYKWASLETLPMDSSTPGQRTVPCFFQILYQQSQQSMVLISFVDLKRYDFSQNLEEEAKKMSPQCPFQFWTSDGNGRLKFSATPSKFWSTIDLL